MAAKNSSFGTPVDPTVIADTKGEIVNQRKFHLPREKVFRAFSDPVLLATWWGPNGFTNTIHEFEAPSAIKLQQ